MLIMLIENLIKTIFKALESKLSKYIKMFKKFHDLFFNVL